MRIVYQRCCGMDAHKDSITACVLLIQRSPLVRKIQSAAESPKAVAFGTVSPAAIRPSDARGFGAA